ncbi:MAG: hypothetical protein MJ074_04580 [Oscillospiraceae bacterium]|nr:hypothetical protein [Oscillospiraceae bacterium]
MDIGKIKDDYSFYEGYEGEPQITLSILGDDIRIHFWDGYFEDLFGTPPLNGDGWIGFTKDYNQLEGAFSSGSGYDEVIPDDYLRDVISCAEKSFAYEETAEARELLREFLQYAVDNSKVVAVTVE